MNAVWITTVLFTASMISFLLTLAVRAVAPRWGFTDRPDQHRKLHKNAVPLGGGLAVFAGMATLLLWLMIVPNPYREILQQSSRWILGMLAAGGAMVVLGLLDDRFSLRGRHKLLGQLVIVLCLVLHGCKISSVGIFGYDFDLGPLAIPCTVLWLLGTINAINLLDGMDGMVTVLGTILAGTFAVVALMTGQQEVAVVALAFTGGLLGFLWFNLPPASIFLGDAGSMFIGLLLGILAIKGLMKGPSTVLLAAPIAMWTLPIFDTMAAIVRRKLTGRSIYTTDRGHLHHRLMEMLGSNTKALFVVALCCLITSAATMISVCLKNDVLALAIGIGIAALLIASDLFGRAEFILLLNRLGHFLRSLLHPRARLANEVFQNSVHLQGSAQWETVWDALTESAEKLSIQRLHLNVNIPGLHEAFSAVWERKESDNSDGCWSLQLPLRVDHQLLGELRVKGGPNGEASQSEIVALLERVKTCESYFQSVMQDKATAQRDRDVHDKRPRVLFLNRSYWPDAEATGQLLTELCEDLTPTFAVTVIAGRPNENPSGAKYHAYSSEVRNGVHIQRVWHTRFAKGKLPGRLMNYISFLLGALTEAICAKRPDIIVVESDPPLLCLIGWFVQLLRGTKLVVYLQDIHPDIAVALGKIRNGVLVRILRKLMFYTYRHADQVIVLSHDMKEHLVASGVPAEQVAIIPNWIDTKKVRPVKNGNPFRKRHGINGEFVVMYSGNLGLCQRLEDVGAAAKHLRERADILFLLIGGGSLKAGLEQQVADLGLANVRFLPYQPKSQISESLSAADVHLVPLDERVASYLMPSKLYGVLASATPLIAIAPEDCELSELTLEHGVGVLACPGEPASLAQAIEQLADDGWDLPQMGKRSRQLAEREFDRVQVTARFAGLLQELAGTQIHLKTELQKPERPQPQTGEVRLVTSHDARV